MDYAGYLLLDGNNLAYKAFHAHDTKTSDGRETGVIFGFFEQLASALRTYPNFWPIIVWDGGYHERLRISSDAVARGIVPSAYKQNRHHDDEQPFRIQTAEVQRMLTLTNVAQCRVRKEEADDVIASYCRLLQGHGTILCYTCDKDYYQLIRDDVMVVSRLRGEEKIIDLEDFERTYGISPSRWVDIGALEGDAGDNIHGVPGCGCKGALELIREHGTCENAVSACQEALSLWRSEYPDVAEEAGIAALKDFGSKRKNNPYLGCYPGMPCSGVALALEEGKIRKLQKNRMLIAMYEERVKLARELKAMRAHLEVPFPRQFDRFDEEAFEKACRLYELNQIRASVSLLSRTGEPP